MSARPVYIIWVTLENLSLLDEINLSDSAYVLVQTPVRQLEEVGRALHGDARVLAVVADDADLSPYLRAFHPIGGTLISGVRRELKFADSGFRPEISDAYSAFKCQKNVLPADVGIRVLGSKWAMPINAKRGISSLQKRHQDARIYVLGNGPSLADVDPAILKDAITIGSNAVYLMFERWGFPVTYWMCEDRLQIEHELGTHRHALGTGTIPLLPFEYAATVDWPEAHFYPLDQSDGIQFPDGVSFPDFAPFGRAFRHGYTVTVSAIHLAAFMGASEIILLGVDHNYDLGGERGEVWSSADARTKTHFDDRYTDRKSFIRPRPLRAEQAYEAARNWGAANGVRILNGSSQSALKVFERIEL